MKQRTLIRVFAVFLALSLAKYFWIAGFAHPVADDYCYAAKSAGMSLWDWSLSEWRFWNGRFTSNLFMINGPLTWFPDMLTGYRLMPIALLLGTFGAIWFLLRRATRHALPTGHELLGAAFILTVYLNLMPDLGEGFYWYTGAITYQLGSILFLVHLALLCPGAQGTKEYPRLAVNLLLAFAIVGMDEVHMLLMAGFHVARGLWLLAVRRPIGSAVAFVPVVLTAGLLMFLAPGNAVRGGMFADTHRFWFSLGMSALQGLRFMAIWLLSPAFLVSALLYMALHRQLRKTIPRLQALLQVPAWIFAALPFLFIMAVTFPAYWSTGLLGQHRTINVACLLFIPSALLGLAVAMERGPLKRMAGINLSTGQSAIMLALALVTFNLTRNDFAVHADLLDGRLAEYDRVMLDREQAIRRGAADPEMRVTLVRLSRPPRTIATYEERGPLREWMMHCQARFLGAGENQVSMAVPWTDVPIEDPSAP